MFLVSLSPPTPIPHEEEEKFTICLSSNRVSRDFILARNINSFMSVLREVCNLGEGRDFSDVLSLLATTLPDCFLSCPLPGNMTVSLPATLVATSETSHFLYGSPGFLCLCLSWESKPCLSGAGRFAWHSLHLSCYPDLVQEPSTVTGNSLFPSSLCYTAPSCLPFQDP